MNKPGKVIKYSWTNNIEPSFNPWVGTTIENLATHNSKKSGCYYEKYIAKPMLEEEGFSFTINPDSTGPWDAKIHRISEEKVEEEKTKKVEIKVARSNTDHKNKCVENFKCVLNHIAIGKDFDILLIVIICLEKNEDMKPEAIYHARWCAKLDLVNHIESPNSLFQKQQGGKKANNDDWICSGKSKIIKLLNNPLFKTIDTLKSIF